MYLHRDVICTDPDHPQATLGATQLVQTVLRRAPTLDRACSRNSPPFPGPQEAPEALTDSRRGMNTAWVSGKVKGQPPPRHRAVLTPSGASAHATNLAAGYLRGISWNSLQCGKSAIKMKQVCARASLASGSLTSCCPAACPPLGMASVRPGRRACLSHAWCGCFQRTECSSPSLSRAGITWAPCSPAGTGTHWG